MRRTQATLLALCCAAPTLAILSATPASAATFGSGDVVVEQVGTGGAALTNAATPVILDEFSAAGGLVQSIPLPQATTNGQNAVTASGTATSEGQLTNSTGNGSLVVPGYSAALGTASVASTSSTSVPRSVALVTSTGAVDSSTSNTAFTGNNIRSATAAGAVVTTVGGNSGVQSETFGGSTSTGQTTTENLRVVHVYGGQTFVSSSSGTAPSMKGIAYVTPKAGSTAGTTTLLPGVTVPGSPYGFALLRTGTGPTYGVNGVDTGTDTLYFADDTSATAGGLFKYVWNGTTWTGQGSIAGIVRGLAARNTANGVEIFSTIDGSLYRTLDTGGSGTLTGSLAAIATAPTNTAFRGVAFAPTSTTLPTPPASLPEAPYAVLLPLIGITAVGVLAMRRSARR